MTLTVQWSSGGAAGRFRERLRVAGRFVAKIAIRVVSPHREALSNLVHMPLFLVGGASIDFAAFHVSHGCGWLVTGISLIVAELAAANE